MFWNRTTDYFEKVKNGGLVVNLNNCTQTHTKLGNEGVRQISLALMDPNTKVQTLCLQKNYLGDEKVTAIFEALKVNSTVQCLYLEANSICVNRDPYYLAKAFEKKNSTLQHLLWHSNRNITLVDGATAIAEALKINSTLQKLYLSWNYIGVGEPPTAIADALKINTTLTDLYLHDNHLRDDGGKAIAEALKINSTLLRLALGANHIGVGGAKAIAEALKINSKLQVLDLRNNHIGVDGATAIAEALTINSKLQVLDLRNNHIGVDGATAIAEALKINSTLQQLHLEANIYIGFDGVTAIANSLKTNSSLQKLGLSKNGIGDSGATAMAEALKVNMTLHHIWLSNNDIGVDGATAIAEALKIESALKELHLDDNHIGNDGAAAIAEVLKTNSTLIRLELRRNNIGNHGAEAIVESLKTNSTLQGIELFANNILHPLHTHIESLLSEENREKRRLGLDNSSLCHDKAPAGPLEQKYSDPKRNNHAPSPQQVTLAQLSPPTEFGDTISTEESSYTPMFEECQEDLSLDHATIRKVLVDEEAEPAELSSQYFELAVKEKASLGEGTFAEVFWFEDVYVGNQFAVKTMRLGLDDKQLEFFKKTSRTEIQTLHRIRNPNFVRLYGYHISNIVGGTHYLLYELPSQRFLASMLKTEEGRKVLTFPRRLGILLGVAQGLNFLHAGIEIDPNRPSVEKYREFHGDINSSSICMTSNFTAKLIDCCLGKLVAKDSKLQLGSGGGSPLGMPAYRDPGYDHGEYSYGSFCDIFSFGVVMAELFTGTLSAVGRATDSGGSSDTRTIYRKYVHVSRTRRDLRVDVDDLISGASKTLLHQLSAMSLECMDEDQFARPSAFQLMEGLQEMINSVQCSDT